MLVFIQSHHRQKGIHRFLDSFLINPDYEIIFIEKAEEIDKYESESAIIGGFLPHDKAIIENATIKNKYYVFCSPLGQADLSGPEFYSQETQILPHCIYLIDKGVYKNVITSSKPLASRFGFIYAPPCIREPEKIRRFTLDRKNYGFLGNNFRKHKNTLNQLAAISEVEPKEPIVVSHEEHYQGYGQLFGCEFISKDLKRDEDYFNEISTHRLCFQVSWSESFDYQALEYFLCGVPVVIGPCIDWYDEMVGAHNLFCFNPVVQNPDNWAEIFNKAQDLVREGTYKGQAETLYERSEIFNERQRDKLYIALKGIQ